MIFPGKIGPGIMLRQGHQDRPDCIARRQLAQVRGCRLAGKGKTIRLSFLNLALDEQRAKAAGIAKFLMKPVSMEEIAQAMEEILLPGELCGVAE
jgi:hypothetical protein